MWRTAPEPGCPPAPAQLFSTDCRTYLCGSVRTRGQSGLGLCRCEGTVVSEVPLLDGSAGQHVLDELGSLVAEQWVALDDVVDLAVDQGLQPVVDAVDRDDVNVGAGLAAGCVHRLDGAQTHVVVVREDQVDALAAVLLQETLHDLLAAVAGELTRLGRDGLDLGALDGVVEAGGPVVRRSRSGSALENHHLGRRAAVLLGGPLAGRLALGLE